MTYHISVTKIPGMRETPRDRYELHLQSITCAQGGCEPKNPSSSLITDNSSTPILYPAAPLLPTTISVECHPILPVTARNRSELLRNCFQELIIVFINKYSLIYQRMNCTFCFLFFIGERLFDLTPKYQSILLSRAHIVVSQMEDGSKLNDF